LQREREFQSEHCSSANLTLQQAKNSRMRIAVKDQIEFLNLVADELDDEFLGIKLAQTVDLRELGTM
jgi:hypothetical protein